MVVYQVVNIEFVCLILSFEWALSSAREYLVLLWLTSFNEVNSVLFMHDNELRRPTQQQRKIVSTVCPAPSNCSVRSLATWLKLNDERKDRHPLPIIIIGLSTDCLRLLDDSASDFLFTVMRPPEQWKIFSRWIYKIQNAQRWFFLIVFFSFFLRREMRRNFGFCLNQCGRSCSRVQCNCRQKFSLFWLLFPPIHLGVILCFVFFVFAKCWLFSIQKTWVSCLSLGQLIKSQPRIYDDESHVWKFRIQIGISAIEPLLKRYCFRWTRRTPIFTSFLFFLVVASHSFSTFLSYKIISIYNFHVFLLLFLFCALWQHIIGSNYN